MSGNQWLAWLLLSGLNIAILVAITRSMVRSSALMKEWRAEAQQRLADELRQIESSRPRLTPGARIQFNGGAPDMVITQYTRTDDGRWFANLECAASYHRLTTPPGSDDAR